MLGPQKGWEAEDVVLAYGLRLPQKVIWVCVLVSVHRERGVGGRLAGGRGVGRGGEREEGRRRGRKGREGGGRGTEEEEKEGGGNEEEEMEVVGIGKGVGG